MKDYPEHFRKLVEAEIPDDSRILMARRAGRSHPSYWRLHDPLRPAKRSRVIRILIPKKHKLTTPAATTT